MGAEVILGDEANLLGGVRVDNSVPIRVAIHNAIRPRFSAIQLNRGRIVNRLRRRFKNLTRFTRDSDQYDPNRPESRFTAS